MGQYVESEEDFLITFIKTLNERERNFTESLKRSTDRLERLLVADRPENVIKEAAASLLQPSEDENHQANIENSICNCNEWGGDRLNERGQWVCKTCEENCSCPEDNWPRVQKPRKRSNNIRANFKGPATIRREDLMLNATKEVKRDDQQTVDKLRQVAIKKSIVDKTPRDNCCPLDDSSNVKDETVECACNAKENGRTDDSKRTLKEHHVVQDKQIVSEFNVEDFQPRGMIKTGQMSRNEYSEGHESFPAENEVELCDCEADDKIQANNICPCGCAEIEVGTGGIKLCTCGCKEIANVDGNDDCVLKEPCNLCGCQLLSEKSSVIEMEKTITTRSEQLSINSTEIEASRAEKEMGMHRKPKTINFRVIREICSYLLVAWNMPENVRLISGYEIRVNRNVVAARVRSPTRTEALIGSLDLSGPATDFPGLMILTLYAIDVNGKYNELSSIKLQICSSL